MPREEKPSVERRTETAGLNARGATVTLSAAAGRRGSVNRFLESCGNDVDKAPDPFHVGRPSDGELAFASRLATTLSL